MKIRIGLIVAAFAALGIVLAACTGNKENKMTVDSLKKKSMDLGDLTSVSYRYGGGMEGESESFTLEITDGYGDLTVSESPYHSAATVVRSYNVDVERVEKIEAYVSEYNLAAWGDLPQSEYIAMDAPTSSYSVCYDNSSVGGSRREYYTVSSDDEYPEGGGEVLGKVRTMLLEMVDPQEMNNAYVVGEDGEELRGDEAAMRVVQTRLPELISRYGGDLEGTVIMDEGLESIEDETYFVFSIGTDNGASVVREAFIAVRNDYSRLMKMDPLTGEWEQIYVSVTG